MNGPPDRHHAVLREVLPQFRIDRVLGAGGGGRVLAARERHSGRRVAIKLAMGTGQLDLAARDRLRLEARILMTCRHPNLIEGYAFHSHSNASVLVMAYFDGDTVLRHNPGRRLPLKQACGIVVAAARALQSVHRLGYLHGDLKPENVLYDPAGRHRLVDFGLARPWPFAVHRQVAGTPWYMAPEAIRAGGELVPATDVYALAIMAYELLAGQLPYPAIADQIGVMRQQLHTRPIPLAVVAPDIPPAACSVVMAGMEKNPRERIATAAQFADSLEAAVAEQMDIRTAGEGRCMRQGET